MLSIRAPGLLRTISIPPTRAGLIPGICLLCLLASCGNKGELYLPGSEADERSLRSIEQVLDDRERQEELEKASQKPPKTPGGEQDPDAAAS